jgi:hypothetical protein
MANKWKKWASERRSVILVAGVLVAIGVLTGVAVGMMGRRGEPYKRVERTPSVPLDTPPPGLSNPVLLDAGTAAGEEAIVSEVEFGPRGESDAGARGAQPLFVRLSQGQAGPQVAEAVSSARGEPLSEDEIAQILSRLPPLEVEAEDQVDFRLPEKLLPPPRRGETVEEAFPSPPVPVVPEDVVAGPLEVLRFAPEGEIPLAPFVSVTFNQPMVPLATLGALAAEEVPVRMEPALAGVWKWLGTKTLSFEVDSDVVDRLPMATEYVVTVPAGIESSTGGVLAEAVHWSFNTPPPKMMDHYPSYGPQPLEPVFVVTFDQQVNPEAVLASIEVRAEGQAVPVRLASEAEIEADKGARRVAERGGKGRWLAFVVQESLPTDASIVVIITPGTPSAEGPLVTQNAQQYDFRTYAPLDIVRHGCSWYRSGCLPLAPFLIQFNNPIDMEAYDESMLRIEPALPGATVNIVRNTITIRGSTIGRTDYRVSVSGDIKDLFGQTLGADEELIFQVGSAASGLFGPEQALVTLDPASVKPIFTVYAINHERLKVRAYRVEPSDWSAYKEYLQTYYRRGDPPTPPGQRVMDEGVELEAVADALTEVNVDLSPALEGKPGHLVVVVEPEGQPVGRTDRYGRVAQAWVQVTQIGLDAFADHSEMVAWATALKDGAPLAGVEIEANPGQQVAVTGDEGTVRFELPAGGASLLVARRGEDTAILPRSVWAWGEEAWERRPVRDELRWYVFDDRAMYRPGEEVHVKGWLRRVGGQQDGDVGLPEGATAVSYQVIGPQGNEMHRDRAAVNALGGFDLAFTLPENANLGQAQIMLDVGGRVGEVTGSGYWHSFQIQEFRRPEFEVQARNETTGPYFTGEHAVVAVEALYFAGGPLPNAEVTWQVSSSPSNYAPPNWPGFVFGRWVPWWLAYEPVYAEEVYYAPYAPAVKVAETFFGVTDASGNHYLRLDFEEAEGVRPVSVLAEATVMDLNRQAWSGATSLLVHPSELYVGLRSERSFVQRSQPLEIEVIVTDLEGVAVPDRRVEVRAARMEWLYRRGGWREEAVDVQECAVGSTLEPVSCTFETEAGGEYEITAVVTDAAGRQNQSQFTRWVSGGRRPAARKVALETVTLIPDRESYQPGDVAQILVQAPLQRHPLHRALPGERGDGDAGSAN